MKYNITSYKVVNNDGLFARQAFHGWSVKGKTWASKNALNCAITHWKRARQFCNPATGVYDGHQFKPARYYDYPIPEDWVVLELTPEGLKEIPARQFYGK